VVLKKLQEFDKIKELILSPQQLAIFEFVSPPLVHLRSSVRRKAVDPHSLAIKVAHLKNSKHDLSDYLQNYLQYIQIKQSEDQISRNLIQHLDPETVKMFLKIEEILQGGDLEIRNVEGVFCIAPVADEAIKPRSVIREYGETVESLDEYEKRVNKHRGEDDLGDGDQDKDEDDRDKGKMGRDGDRENKKESDNGGKCDVGEREKTRRKSSEQVQEMRVIEILQEGVETRRSEELEMSPLTSRRGEGGGVMDLEDFFPLGDDSSTQMTEMSDISKYRV